MQNNFRFKQYSGKVRNRKVGEVIIKSFDKQTGKHYTVKNINNWTVSYNTLFNQLKQKTEFLEMLIERNSECKDCLSDIMNVLSDLIAELDEKYEFENDICMMLHGGLYEKKLDKLNQSQLISVVSALKALVYKKDLSQDDIDIININLLDNQINWIVGDGGIEDAESIFRDDYWH